MNDRAERIEKAKQLFVTISELDGCGIVVTDDNLLAETLAEQFDLSPEEVNENYEAS